MKGALTVNGRVILTESQFQILRRKAGEDIEIEMNSFYWDDVIYLRGKGYLAGSTDDITSLGEVLILLIYTIWK